MSKRTYGCIFSEKDSRDLPYVPKAPAALPVSTDLRSYATPVRDQMTVGACTGFSTAAMIELLDVVHRKPANPTQISPLFLYYEARKREGTLPADQGAQLRTLMKVITGLGAVPEKQWPFAPSRFDTEPAGVGSHAADYKLGAYHAVGSLDDVRAALSEDYPVVMAMAVPRAMEDFQGPLSCLGVHNASDERMGGHAVCCVGYNDKDRRLVIKNSWGEDWGDRGYFYLSYEAYPIFIYEAWMAHYGSPWRPA